ncbi:uncharacterized protein B0H18DRAFT_1012806 [Fomitopsis serialis]|uniref:uncharacterized protein n=1 Tax=Fomitopsis serialis TaxID=139415 RepID=UPI0020078F66|nr:uncharacterized protein B0H18DRAFT_1029631 [Neoantrodia serialis]XP_047892389.1 uncharacterized protein B0H18DRAFT_1012806 [Neoantrodia serialis]KAH9918951.1 hypothetical protein B0H18DRAFT_1029631 [Neoantrodia serialis]KAH9924201.1 hypothetical protein B0H18DRAFT_1012806 [Neoantrodia serialis]
MHVKNSESLTCSRDTETHEMHFWTEPELAPGYVYTSAQYSLYVLTCVISQVNKKITAEFRVTPDGVLTESGLVNPSIL